MANIYELRKSIEAFIDSLAASRVDRFYPSALAKNLGISSGEAFNFLLERSGERDQLQLMWELRCPSCYRTLSMSPEKTTGNDDYECYCGEEFEPKPSDFYPVFKINPDYKTYIREGFKKKSHLSRQTLQMI